MGRNMEAFKVAIELLKSVCSKVSPQRYRSKNSGNPYKIAKKSQCINQTNGFSVTCNLTSMHETFPDKQFSKELVR